MDNAMVVEVGQTLDDLLGVTDDLELIEGATLT